MSEDTVPGEPMFELPEELAIDTGVARRVIAERAGLSVDGEDGVP